MLEAEVADHPHLNVVEFIQDPQALLHRASWVVAMGGYNTTCEILAHGKRALIVPRVRPRTEQLIRAQRLSRLGLIDLMHPDTLSATGLTDWMAKSHERQANRRHQAEVDLGGFDRLPFFLSALLAGEPTTYAKPINIRPRSECLTQ